MNFPLKYYDNIMELISFINQSLEIGLFTYDEAKSQVAYKNVFSLLDYSADDIRNLPKFILNSMLWPYKNFGRGLFLLLNESNKSPQELYQICLDHKKSITYESFNIEKSSICSEYQNFRGKLKSFVLKLERNCFIIEVKLIDRIRNNEYLQNTFEILNLKINSERFEIKYTYQLGIDIKEYLSKRKSDLIAIWSKLSLEMFLLKLDFKVKPFEFFIFYKNQLKIMPNEQRRYQDLIFINENIDNEDKYMQKSSQILQEYLIDCLENQKLTEDLTDIDMIYPNCINGLSVKDNRIMIMGKSYELIEIVNKSKLNLYYFASIACGYPNINPSIGLLQHGPILYVVRPVYDEFIKSDQPNKLKFLPDLIDALLYSSAKKINLFAFDWKMLLYDYQKDRIILNFEDLENIKMTWKSYELNNGFYESKSMVFSIGILIYVLLDQKYLNYYDKLMDDVEFVIRKKAEFMSSDIIKIIKHYRKVQKIKTLSDDSLIYTKRFLETNTYNHEVSVFQLYRHLTGKCNIKPVCPEKITEHYSELVSLADSCITHRPHNRANLKQISEELKTIRLK